MDLNYIIFSNLSFIFLPIYMYFFYIVYKRTFAEKESALFLIITIYSILYIEFKYGINIFESFPLLMINVPLVICTLKKRKYQAIIISIILIIYNYTFFNDFLILIVLEYLLYYLFSLKYRDNIYGYLLVFTIIKTITLSICVFITNFDIVNIFKIISEVVTFYLISLIVIFAFVKGQKLFKVFLSVKELERHKQIKNSLFKISHEIKNPIAVCKGYLDMLDINDENQVKEYIPILKEEVDRTLNILEDFLSMNKLKIKKDILDINLLLEEILKSYQLIFRKNNINLETNIDDEEIFVNGDYNRLTQVVINILKNSLEAKDPNKKKKLEIDTEIKDNCIYIKFLDNGIGISKENLKRIKEPFFTTKIGGTGLGISLSTEIINAHNGEISFDSEEGAYTLVTIKLPIMDI